MSAMPDHCYVVFCRLIGLDDMANDEISGAVQGLKDVLQTQCNGLDGAECHSSVYGRFVVVPLSVKSAVDLAKHAVGATAERGIHITVGIAGGRLEGVNCLPTDNVAGHPINKAARLAFLSESVGWIAVDAVVADDARFAAAEFRDAFGDETTGHVKRTELNYRPLLITPPQVTLPKPKGPFTSNVAHVVAYDIINYSECDLRKQVALIMGLDAIVKRAEEGTGGQTRPYSHGGDGGVLVFRSGKGGARAAWNFAKALRDHCRNTIPVRIGLATGQLVFPPDSEPIGHGVLQADRASGIPPEGDICCTKQFWEQSIEPPDRNGWHTEEKIPGHLIVTPDKGDYVTTTLNLTFVVDRDHFTFDLESFVRAIEDATGYSLRGLKIEFGPGGSTIVEMKGEPRTLRKIFEQLRSEEMLLELSEKVNLLSVTAVCEDGSRETIESPVVKFPNLVFSDVQPPPIRPLLRMLEYSLATGDLKNSELGRDVVAAFQDEKDVRLAEPFVSHWMITAIRLSDLYFALVRLGAGQRDWQRDFAQTATPILVGLTWSLERSPDAQAIVSRLCDVIAKRLRLELRWPTDANESNDLKNAIYRACLKAGELECDEVLVELKGLAVSGPS